MDDKLKMRVALLRKTVRNCCVVTVVLAILAVAVFAWGMSILSGPRTGGARVGVLDGLAFIVTPWLFMLTVVGLIMALTERGEARFVMSMLSGEEKEELRRMNKMRLILGFAPLFLMILQFVIAFIVI